ncbi:MAG: MBOAT family protein [Eubacterium sp.]|nr:MBOAT family protein [Eubacterium sp.]MBR1532214.1 MBOAT family protein [Eubacterium sp.]
MVFSSSTFLILFLPVTVILYYLFGALTKNTNVKNIILLIASLVFYAWGEPVYIILMLISIIFNFVIGQDIDAARSGGNDKLAKRKFVLSIVFSLAVLGFFKYFGFVVDNINTLLHASIRVPQLALPVGISFYTFQIMSYVIDLYRGNVKVQKNLFAFALYISLFPQLIAGPIVRYADIEYQLQHRRESFNKFAEGITRFTVGLGKKLILANTLGAVYSGVQELGAQDTSVITAWIGIICYTLQIYFDFSGYSDMAIGLGRMFGFKFVENFNYPYIADSVTDFWRRWHISLSTWFREYVYIPLGGNRCKTPRVIFNLMVVWLLTGLWHGAAWNFIMWGVYYGVLLILEKYVFSGVIKKLPSPVRHILTMVIVMLGWVFFSAPTLTEAVHYIGAMFGQGGGFADSQSAYLLSANWLPLIIGMFCATPIYKKVAEVLPEKLVNILRIVAIPLLLVLCIIFMISETYNPFLYFRF